MSEHEDGAAAGPAVEVYDPTKDPKMRPANWQSANGDPGWKHAIYADLANKNNVKCLLCNKIMSAGIRRLKRHLVGIYSDVTRCPKATAEIRNEMAEAIKKGERGKQGLVEDIDAEQRMASSPKVPKPQKSVLDMLQKTAKEVVAGRQTLGPNQKSFEQCSKKTKEQKQIVDDHVADFFYENGIPLNAVNSRSWEILLKSVGQYGPGYITCSRAKKRTENMNEMEQHNDANGPTFMQCGYEEEDDDGDIQQEVASPHEGGSAFQLDEVLDG